MLYRILLNLDNPDVQKLLFHPAKKELWAWPKLVNLFLSHLSQKQALKKGEYRHSNFSKLGLETFLNMGSTLQPRSQQFFFQQKALSYLLMVIRLIEQT